MIRPVNPLEWPQCGEPYASALQQFAQKWIAGEMSNGDLALELIELQQKAIYAEREAREDGRRVPDTLGTARREIAVLCQALAEYRWAPFDSPSTAEDRQLTFDVALRSCRRDTSVGRDR